MFAILTNTKTNKKIKLHIQEVEQLLNRYDLDYTKKTILLNDLVIELE